MKQIAVMETNLEIIEATELNAHSQRSLVSDPNLEVCTEKAPSFLKKHFKNLIIDSCWLPKNNFFNMVIIFTILSMTTWMLIFIILDSKALPGGIYFSLLVLLISGHVFGYLFEKIKLPSLLG